MRKLAKSNLLPKLIFRVCCIGISNFSLVQATRKEWLKANGSKLEELVSELRRKKPLVVNLTNDVSMDMMANSLLAIGAAPIMSNSEEELEELIRMASAININIGTLDESFIHRAFQATRIAKNQGIPIVLDPVGSGATQIRTRTARSLVKEATVVRGNASEIMSLLEDRSPTRGVESVNSTEEAKAVARTLAQRNNQIVVVSGEVDFVTNGEKDETLSFGSPLMTQVTAMGCSLNAIIAAFCASEPDFFKAATLSAAYFGLCGSLAAQKARGPGSFRVNFIDELSLARLKAMYELYSDS